MSVTSPASAGRSRPRWLVPVVVVGVVVVLIVVGISGSYNGLVKSRNGVDQQFSNIDVQLQRRFDLVPNLVNSVKGAQQQEKDVIGAISSARTQYAGAKNTDEKVAAANSFDSAFARLLVINEQYPDLKSNQTVQSLITELEGTENRISQERRKYNDVATEYNSKVESFPRNVIAGMFGFDKRSLFKTSNPAAQNAPTVDLSSPTTAAK